MKISNGKQTHAVRVVLYGTEGIGKSTLVSHFPQPLYIDVESGTMQLDVNRFEDINTWGDILNAVDYVQKDPSVCKTLILDTADKAEQMLISSMLANDGKSSIEDYGYGKGYTLVQEAFQSHLLNRLDRVIAKGIHVVVVAHAIVKTVTPPDSDPYDHWELKCSRKVSPLLKEWADMLLFANYEQTIIQTENGKGHASGSGKRMLYCNHKPTYDAKNRYGLPDKLPLEYKSIEDVIDGQIKPAELKTELNVDTPTDSIVEGNSEGLESPQDVLRRRIEQNGMTVDAVEKWLRETGRIEPDGEIGDLADSTAKSMAQNIEQLKTVIGGESNE